MIDYVANLRPPVHLLCASELVEARVLLQCLPLLIDLIERCHCLINGRSVKLALTFAN